MLNLYTIRYVMHWRYNKILKFSVYQYLEAKRLLYDGINNTKTIYSFNSDLRNLKLICTRASLICIKRWANNAYSHTTQHTLHTTIRHIHYTHTKQKNEEWQEIATLSQSLETFKWYLYLNYIRKLNAVGGGNISAR